MSKRFLRWGWGAFITLFLLACQTQAEPEPLIVYVTATPAVASPLPTMQVAELPSATPIAFPSATPTETIEGVPSPTPYFSPTPSATPSFTATPSVSPTLAAFPSATPFPTLTPGGLLPTVPPAFTGVPTRPPSATPTSFVVESLQPPDVTQIAEVVPPPAVSELAPPPEALPILQASRIGIQLHPFVTNEEWANALGLTNQLGFGWIKFQVPWDICEPRPGEYSFEYQRLVLLVQQAHILGFKVLLGVTRAPSWARPPEADLALHGPPSDPQALANFITRLVTDIKPEFMEALEVWNEPNLVREWAGLPMDGATYMRYFAPAYQAVKALDPSAVVVTAGLAPVGEVPSARDDRAFLREMYAAGLNDFPQARLGVHPYAWANPPEARCCSAGGWADSEHFFLLETLDRYRQIVLENDDTQRRFWVTEFGWGTYQAINVDGSDGVPPTAAEFFTRITLRQQAEYTVRAFEILQSPPYAEFVEALFLWNMNFATIQNAIPNQLEQAGYSLLDAGGRPRPLFYYLLNTRKIYDADDFRR